MVQRKWQGNWETHSPLPTVPEAQGGSHRGCQSLKATRHSPQQSRMSRRQDGVPVHQRSRFILEAPISSQVYEGNLAVEELAQIQKGAINAPPPVDWVSMSEEEYQTDSSPEDPPSSDPEMDLLLSMGTYMFESDSEDPPLNTNTPHSNFCLDHATTSVGPPVPLIPPTSNPMESLFQEGVPHKLLKQEWLKRYLPTEELQIEYCLKIRQVLAMPECEEKMKLISLILPHPLPNSPVAARFTCFYKRWENAGAPSWVVDTLAHGMQLDWICNQQQIPLQRPMFPYKLDPEDEAEVCRQLDQQVQDSALEDVSDLFQPSIPSTGIYYAPLFIVHQKNGKKRLITDYTDINQFLKDISFKMETTRTVRQLVATRKFQFGAGLDITNAFPHFGTRREDRNLLLLLGPNNKVYRPSCAFFGLKPIPRLWTKVSRFPLRIFRQNGIVCLLYIDDGFNLANTELETFLDMTFMILILQYLGYTMSWKKVMLPIPRPVFLGFVWDLVKGVICLTPEKLRHVRKILKQTLAATCITMRKAASLLGILQSVREAVQFVTLEIRELQRQFNLMLKRPTGNPWTLSLSLSPTMKQGIRNILHHLMVWNGKSYLPPQIDVVIKTDASDLGLGGNLKWTASHGSSIMQRTSALWTPKLLHGYLHGIHTWKTICSWFRHPLNQKPLTELVHIQILEAIATHQALKVFTQQVQLQHKTALILTDNMANAYYLAREGGTRSTPLSLVIERILRWARKKKLHLFVEHIPGVLNELAVCVHMS